VDKLLGLALEAARLAGSAILRYYQQPLSVTHKQDGSPLTLADQAAHQVIVSHLAQSGLTIVSEEEEDLHLDAERYWLVDPLDGTKDFLAGNGEFTVNIALVDQGRPVLGVVFSPALDEVYWGGEGSGAWRGRGRSATVLLPQAYSPACRMAVSRFHDHPDVDLFAAQNGIDQRVAIGSALKYCLLAAAEVDVFPRLVGSSEWDTAAGQAVLEAAGGQVLDWHTGKALQ
jgi:3'(2'), 5'-bisphosphate nucleotidase